LAVVLAHVADVEVTVLAVERPPPGIAKAIADDLPAVRVLAQELAELRAQLLRVVVAVAAAASVTGGEVEVSCMELEGPPVVVRVSRMLSLENRVPRAGLHVTASARERVANGPQVPVVVREVDPHPVFRPEAHPQEPPPRMARNTLRWPPCWRRTIRPGCSTT